MLLSAIITFWVANSFWQLGPHETLNLHNSTNPKVSVPKGFGGGSNSSPGDWEEIYSKWNRGLKINNKILKGSIEPPNKEKQ